MDIEGASAVVTGGASGIGAACARLLSARGARCVILDRSVELGEALAEEVEGEFARADVADVDDVTSAIQLAEGLGPVRLLVNAAGIGNAFRTVDRDGQPFPLEEFERIIRVNLVGAFNCLRLVAAAIGQTEPVDRDGQRGAIVNIASVAAFDGQTGQAAYSASKGGVVGMTLPIARDLAALGIRVNTVAPGLIDTPIYGEGPDAEAFKAHLGKSVLFPRRLGVSEELASVVVELLANDYTNAEIVRVDGGIRMPAR